MFAGCTNFNQNISYFAFTGASQPVMNGMFSGASSFNQDLSSWCVSLIPTQPTNFNINANSTWVNTPSKQPRWGQPCNNSVIIGTVSSPINSLVEVPIVFNVNSPVNLGAISLKIVYNPTLLSCATPRISYTWSGFTSNPSYLDNCATFAGACGINQAIVVAWSSVDGPSFVGGELLKLRFNTLGTTGLTPLTVTCIPEDNEIANQSGTRLNVTFVNGSVNITQ
jgi:hypothetical protein